MAIISYRNVMDLQSMNNNARRINSYISNMIKASDETGKVTVEDRKYGETLILTDDTGDGIYETRIYQDKGKLYEEYSKKSKMETVTAATELADTETFEISKESGIVDLITDEGETIVALRSEG